LVHAGAAREYGKAEREIPLPLLCIRPILNLQPRGVGVREGE
jgi:hypothetical protein